MGKLPSKGKISDPDAKQDALETNPQAGMVKMTPQMVHSIRNSRKGKVPAGLAKYMASKKKV